MTATPDQSHAASQLPDAKSVPRIVTDAQSSDRHNHKIWMAAGIAGALIVTGSGAYGIVEAVNKPPAETPAETLAKASAAGPTAFVNEVVKQILKYDDKDTWGWVDPGAQQQMGSEASWQLTVDRLGNLYGSPKTSPHIINSAEIEAAAKNHTVVYAMVGNMVRITDGKPYEWDITLQPAGNNKMLIADINTHLQVGSQG